MSRRYQRCAFADERWDDADDELIDRPFIEKGGDESRRRHRFRRKSIDGQFT